MSNQRYSPEFKDEAIANGHPGLGNRSAAALGLYNNLKLKSRWRRDTAYRSERVRSAAARRRALPAMQGGTPGAP